MDQNLDQNKVSLCPISREQKRIMLEYVQAHPELAAQKFSKDFTFKKAQQQWEELTNLLNSVPGGSKKEWRKWRKTWTDMKKNAKTKASEIKKYSEGTGGGPTVPKEKNINDIEKGILEVIGKVVVAGHQEITETPIDFQFDVPNNPSVMETDEVQIIYSEEVQCEDSPHGILKNTTADEHNYSTSKNLLTPTSAGGTGQKRLTSTKRLENSQKISTQMLKTMETRTTSINDYHNQKVAYFQHLREYHKEKIDLLKENNILGKEILKELKDLKKSLLAGNSLDNS